LFCAGQGSYGKVFVSKLKASNELVAIKRIDKYLVQKENKVGAVHREKLIM
jgi:serine/threonine protein kinase